MSELQNLSLEEKVAQMFVMAYRDHESAMKFVKNGVGGIWPIGIPKNDVQGFRRIIGQLQEAAKIPLFISDDFEQGVGQAISNSDNCTDFSSMMAFGAIADGSAGQMAYKAGQVVADEAPYLGINTTPSPVFDVNTVPENPVCNTRSVGDDGDRVTEIALKYALGMASTGRLLPQAKHFPGEGMHYMDPHLGLEVMQVSAEQMEEIHLKPFIAAHEASVPMMMTNHAIYPPYDADFPATLSRKIITNLLREKIGFEGLVITDAMEMHGITERYGCAESLVLAINAGNDLILGPSEHEQQHAIEQILEAVSRGEIKHDTINLAVARILRFKKLLGLSDNKLDMPEPKMPLESRQAIARQVAQKSITLFKDAKSTLPLKVLPESNLLCVEPSHPDHSLDWGLRFNIHGLSEFVKERCRCNTCLFRSNPGAEDIADILDKAGSADMILISTFFRSKAGQTGLLTEGQVELLRQLNNLGKPTVFVVSNPYVISEIPFAETVVVSYGNDRMSVRAAVDVIFGAIQARGVLPVKIPDFIDPSKVKIIAHDC